MAELTPDATPSSPLLTNPTISAPASSLDAQPTSTKLKRFRFTETYDLVLLKAVRSVDAHIPDWGKSESLYEEVLKLFISDVPAAVFVHSQKPSRKTLADRYKRLVSQRREKVKATAAASGIIEKHGDKEVLLDDLILEMDEKEEATKAEKEQQTETERRLVVAGENIRSLALKRRQEDSDGGDTPFSGRKKRNRRLETGNSDDELTASMLSQAAMRREVEEGRLELERKRMEMDEQRVARETERFEKAQDASLRRLELDEKRFELEKEERKQSLAERKKMVDVMELLCKKLQ